MGHLTSSFDEALHALPDGWSTATLDVRVRAMPEHLRGIADAAVSQFAAVGGAYLVPGGAYRVRVASSAGAGLPVAPQVAVGLAMLDRSNVGAELSLVEVQTARPDALSTWEQPDTPAWRGRRQRHEAAPGEVAVRAD